MHERPSFSAPLRQIRVQVTSINNHKYNKSGLNSLAHAGSIDVVGSQIEIIHFLKISGCKVAGIKHSRWRLKSGASVLIILQICFTAENLLIFRLQIEPRLSHTLFLLFLMLESKTALRLTFK